MGSLLYDLNKR